MCASVCAAWHVCVRVGEGGREREREGVCVSVCEGVCASMCLC